MKVLTRPPRIKVLEAAGSIGDARIKLVDENTAKITSSRGEKEYIVVVVKDGENSYRVYSNDNGTVFKGYVGYPIIAFMMVKGILPVDNEVIKAMTGIPWKDLNEKYGKYSVVENIVLNRAEKMGFDRNVITDYVNLVLKKLGLLKVVFDEKLRPPEVSEKAVPE
ncbi:hypothetical protein TCELL_0573 [Thermogladius calderae 1633]|uniref:Uncharacterized protein n=1 Tax=Thermogladius calderae (strain DSM 22663 / VKM B-2946 / 1633) TaxID=1184251 RepID=I3TE10_THEC1|nr:hypothetical protein [Thermogladius calderae]AFK50998.1 hypothetical protein TCELL_0573 [Thermogladius calderae 1633]